MSRWSRKRIRRAARGGPYPSCRIQFFFLRKSLGEGLLGAKPNTSQIPLEIFLVLNLSLGVYYSQVGVIFIRSCWATRWTPRQMYTALSILRPVAVIKHPLYLSGVWIVDTFLVNFRGPFGAIMADHEPSGPRQASPEGFPDLRCPHETSGAHLGTRCWSFSREV